MAAWPCRNKLSNGTECEASKNAGIHSRFHREYHEYMKDKPIGIQPVSAPMKAYLASQQHKDVYSEAEAYCVGHALGAPGRCQPPLTKHHTLHRSYAGLEYSEANAPVVTLCAWLNGAIESDADVRKWAETHTFNRNGVEYPFLVGAKDVAK